MTLRWKTAIPGTMRFTVAKAIAGLLLTCAFSLSAMAAAEQRTPVSAPVPLGKLTPFWRYSNALGPFLEEGEALIKIPDYVLMGDFKYTKRPFAREAPFADELSIVRLLGGYSGGDNGRDLAYRGADGKIYYRLQLLKPRLAPYLDNGYSHLMLVLDNVPWCFPVKPHEGDLGQIAPPGDEREWHDFIKAVCEEVVKIAGEKTAEGFQFRVGTENNSPDRFDGSQEQYFEHYDQSVAGIRDVLPHAQIGAFNIAGVEYGDIEHQNVNSYALAAHCVNHVPPEPFDWVAFSRYYRPGDDPLSHEQTCKLVWDEFERRIPRLKGVSREMHEFGVAPFANPGKHQFVSEEPGALGAALTCQMMLRLRQAGIDRLWHWATYDELPHNRDRLYLFSGQAWLLSIMEAMAGGDTFLFAPLDGSAAKTEDLLAGSFKQGHELLLVSSYNADSANHATESVRFRIPKKLADISGNSMTWTRLAFGQSPHDLIRADLAKAKLLKKEFIDRPDRLGTLREMAMGREADEILFRNWDAYKKCWTASLTLKPWDTSVGTLAFDAQGAVLSVRMTPPEVVVISIKSPSRNAQVATRNST